jgi:hypothetical protein
MYDCRYDGAPEVKLVFEDWTRRHTGGAARRANRTAGAA